MLIRLPLIGRGTPLLPYRVAVPTYEMVLTDYDRLEAVVSIPDIDAPADAELRAVLRGTAQLRHGYSTQLVDAAAEAWHAHLDERYVEHRGVWRPRPLRSNA